MTQRKKKDALRIRGIALPNEHGSWGILAEPLVAAIAVAPSVPGIAVILVFVGAFLVRQPLKVFLLDRFETRQLPRTEFALKCIILFGGICFLGLIGTVALGRPEDYIAATVVVPFGVYQIYSDLNQKNRRLLPEMTGTLAISSSAAFIALAGGWPYSSALALWAIICARLIPSIIYVRNRLRLEKGKPYSVVAVVASNCAALFFAAALSVYGLASFLTVAVFALLLARSTLGLSSLRKNLKAIKIGIWEVIYGALTVLSIIIGYYFNI